MLRPVLKKKKKREQESVISNGMMTKYGDYCHLHRGKTHLRVFSGVWEGNGYDICLAVIVYLL